MACVLTTGIALGCRDAKGGLADVLITELANIELVAKTAKNITGITMADGTQFWRYQQDIEKAFFTETIQTSRENGSRFYEVDLDIFLYKGSAATQAELELLASNRLAIIVKDNNGAYWLIGETNGAMVEPSTNASGTLMGDFNGYNIKFKAKEPSSLCTVTGSIISDLLEPAV